MSTIIYVTGEGCINGKLGKEKISEVEDIRNVWNDPAFHVREDGQFEFMDDQYDGCTPYEDGILKPLNSLIKYAEEKDFIINAEFNVKCDCSDYDNIRIIIEDNVLSTANAEIANASEEELTEEIYRRYKKLLDRTPEEVLCSRTDDNWVEGYIQIHISDIIDNDFETFLDLISEALVGSDLLMNVDYKVIAMAGKGYPNEVILKVRGDASTIVEERE